MSDLQDVDAERRAECALDILRRTEREHAAAHRRPASLSLREALEAIRFESLVVFMAATSVANGFELSDTDRERLTLAVRRIDGITGEFC